MAPPTILAHKSAFLTAQTLQLSQTLAPTRAWQSSNDRSEHALAEKAVDDALYRLNHTLLQHAKRVYAPQATRHVAEQIERLYLNSGEVAGDDYSGEPGDLADGSLRVGTDFATDSAIADLAATWDLDSAPHADDHPLEARRYAELQSRLTELSAQRKEAQARLERLRRMKSLVEPFREGVQENLVTRNGELEKELERMRMLLVRVSGRIAELPAERQSGDGDDAIMEDLDAVEKRKVDSLLDSF